MESIREIFAAAVFLAFAGLFLWMLVGNIQSLIQKKKAPTKTVIATLETKSKETGAGEFDKKGVRLGKSVYSAAFMTEDRQSLTFTVSESEWNRLSEGSLGHLTYREKQFLGFTPDGLLEESDRNV